MFRPNTSTSSRLASPSKQQHTDNNSSTTIREIRSRAVGGASQTATTTTTTTNHPAPNSNSRQHLLANRRQAMSMEKLSGSSSSVASTVQSNSNDKETKSPSGGSSNSINSSPSRNGGLNRTASRVSRFRSAKAVFERLSSANGSNPKLDTSGKPEQPNKSRGTVASRYAAAAAARATSHSQTSAANSSSSSPRSRIATNSLARAHESGKSSSNIEIHRSSTTSSNQNSPIKSESSQPKPQPRVICSRSVSNSMTTNGSGARQSGGHLASSTKNNLAQAKPPPKDLIDKIVLEIALDAGKQLPDLNCTIQDLSNCDVSGIPETLDFDQCFQDVEMMTEEEARKLLSRKHDLSTVETTNKGPNKQTSFVIETSSNNGDKQDAPSSATTTTTTISVGCDKSINEASQMEDEHPKGDVLSATSNTSVAKHEQEGIAANQFNITTTAPATLETSGTSSTSLSSNKSKVRFSEEPVRIFDTYAVEDYDRGNDEIDPVSASAEYELEKSREREGLHIDDGSDDEESRRNCSDVNGAVGNSDQFNQRQPTLNIYGAPHSGTHHGSHQDAPPHNDSQDSYDREDEDQAGHREYVESLEREVNLKRILEQNLRDLQSQYYEAVKELDDYKGATETKLSELGQTVSDLNGKLENSHNELTDTRDQSAEFEKQLNEIKESSQILEKKYHRAKKIIKDMQSREQSFNRREQLYQQKLDEIEYELGVLIESVDRTVHDDGLKFFTLLDNTSTSSGQRPQQYQARLDVIGFIRQMLSNFNSNQSTQNPQIKQRVVSILEQQIANLMVVSNGNTSVIGKVSTIPVKLALTKINSNDNSQLPQAIDSNKHSQTYQLASHRLSQPNLPHPIGVGGQPTKFFHNLHPMPVQVTVNEPSPPQSVNSYPSTNSLNSLNNNNNNNSMTNNNNVVMAAKLREQQPSISDVQLNMAPIVSTNATVSSAEDKFQPAADIQVPYQTNEWHDKPVSEWTTTQVSTWLLALGLDQYISKFEDRNVNGQSLINLDSTVLKGLGVLNSNDRNLLKKKIRELRVEMEKERKLFEKKMKENLKDKSKNKLNGNNRTDSKTDAQQNRSSWKKSLLS